ncbi:M1 family metallopeptidase [Psychroserpens algicola]|uniref:M1 family metallopeptidase n=1 Tax=Psychroserpens algicola TaxID=1719034 RepID=A0ABT0H7T7_9FLAO|nr:M1 family metallopeptidase [Psychroserpens algicola]MCK8480420.1 M1 family metallopeptidase [Psychroserpens algicola]
MRLPIVLILCLSVCFYSSEIKAQNLKMTYKTDTYWQQQADYTMAIDMDVESYQFSGTQNIKYTNNSPDVLDKVFYHLYFNAFQPNSEMDARVQSIKSPDRRFMTNVGTEQHPIYGSRIARLKADEIGYIKIQSLTQNGEPLSYELSGTVVEVKLNQPIQPGETVNFDMVFNGQVPVQIRRSGRNNKEGVALSMAQWYPKLAEYDDEGWHAYEYIAREFHGVWGNYDVKITIDKDYTIAGTGYLQNPDEIGHGYSSKTVTHEGEKLTWHFLAPNVHDFTWAADPEYIHDKLQVPDGPMLHFFYKETMAQEQLDNWKYLQPYASQLMVYFSDLVGKYPYEQYSIIQGGDGGMEYGMCTLVLGEGTFDGLFKGTISHEMAHAWFQFLLANNEAKHEWMDEGFATYIEYKAMNDMFEKDMPNPWIRAYMSYKSLALSGEEQPMTTFADKYDHNSIYSKAAYYKGCVFLVQLGYIIGEENLDKALKRYFNEWAFKHPKPIDFIRVAEKVSGLELDWYLIDFAQTTNTIDYAVKKPRGKTVTLERIGLMPMPIDLTVTYADDTTEDFYIPLRDMRGEKTSSATLLPDWAWSYPVYSFEASKKVKSVVIDPKGFMADIEPDDNSTGVKK